MWTYTEYYDGTIKKGTFDPSFDRAGVTPSGPPWQKAQTPAWTPVAGSGVMPSREVILVDDQSKRVAHTPSPVLARTRDERPSLT